MYFNSVFQLQYLKINLQRSIMKASFVRKNIENILKFIYRINNCDTRFVEKIK